MVNSNVVMSGDISYQNQNICGKLNADFVLYHKKLWCLFKLVCKTIFFIPHRLGKHYLLYTNFRQQ